MVLLTMDYSFLNIQILVLQGIVMPIGQKMQMIEKILLVDVFILKTIWFFSTARNKILSPCQLQDRIYCCMKLLHLINVNEAKA